MGKLEAKGSMSQYVDNINLVDLVSVSKKMIFVRDKKNQLFSAKLKIINQSPRFISYKVRSSNKELFQIFHQHGSISPHETVEVVVATTQRVQEFKDISNESFRVFALPIYDKRQLNKKSLNVLWKAHGTHLFPSEATEVHKIPYVLPSNDTYFENLSVLERISNMNHLFGLLSWGKDKFSMEFDENGNVNEDEFYLYWPSKNPDSIDQSLEDVLSDWQILAKKCHRQTQAIVNNTNLTAAAMFAGVIALLALTYLSSSGAIELSKRPNIVDIAYKPAKLLTEYSTDIVWNWLQSWWKPPVSEDENSDFFNDYD